jgi:kumamolisin
VPPGESNFTFSESQPCTGSKENLTRLTILLLFTLSLSLSLQAQLAQPPTSVAPQRITFAGSIKQTSSTAPSLAFRASATLVRSQLTKIETEGTVEFSIALKMRDSAGLQQRIGQLEIISLEEMTAKYYPTMADYITVAHWLTSQGFTVKPADKTNLSVFASGSVTQIERAFATKFARISFAGVESSSAQLAPSLPTAVAGPVLGINGLQPYSHPKPHSVIASGQPQKLTNNQPPYTVNELANAYGATGLGVNGSGQKIAIVIDTVPASSDLTLFWQQNGIAQSLSNIEAVQVVAGALPAPSGEETLDVEWSSSMAPGAKVRVYATTDLGFVHLDQAYQAIINDLPSQPTLHQVSLSYGLGETYESVSQMQTDAQYFASLAGRGVTVFVSSGDGGSSPGLNGWEDNSGPVQVECPANDPNVTSVGGTSLYLNSSNGSVSGEVAWSFGGGGSSQVFARPSWQKGAGVPSGTHRTVPDVALDADINTGGFLVLNGQGYFVGGTSWGAPTWAAFCAMINQACANSGQSSVGLLGPLIYPLNGTGSFRGITTGSNGSNGVYNAGPGYNLCTGLGVPNVKSLMQSIVSSLSGTIPQVFPAANLNGDGRSDPVFFNKELNEVGIWLMSGNTIVRGVVLANPPVNSQIDAVADLQGTGRAQIIWSNNSASFIAWSIAWSGNNTPTTTATSFRLPTNYPVLVCADLDGDGLLDIVQYNPANGALLIAKNNGSLNFTTQFSTTVGLGWALIGAADLNGNGHPQLIWRNLTSGMVAAWVFSATQPFQPVQYPTFASPSLAWSIRGIGRVDTTLAKGLIWHNDDTGAVAFWKMNTNGSLLGTTLPAAGAPWQIASDAYFDGSGASPEILWVNQNSGAIAVWRVNGGAIAGSAINTPGTSWVVQPTGL